MQIVTIDDTNFSPGTIDALAELVKSVNADRIWLHTCRNFRKIEFHPSGTFCVEFEVLGNRLGSHLDRYQNIPIATFLDEFLSAERNGFAKIDNVRKFHPSSRDGNYQLYLHASRGISSFYVAALYHNNKMIGGLGCDWVDNDMLTDESVKAIQDCARRLEGLFNGKQS